MDLNKFRDVDLVIDKANANFMQRQFVSQGDLKGRTLTVQITDRGVIGEVPGLTLNLRWTNTASGLTDLSAFECIDQENSLFRIEYPTNMLTPGKVLANIQVIQNGKITHLKTFEITVQRLSGEMVGVTGQAEYGALVAVLADANKLRTDIIVLDNEKANKQDLAAANAQVSNLVDKKVDKGGNEQISVRMLSPEVRQLIGEGGEIAVNTSMLEKDAVQYVNLRDEGNIFGIEYSLTADQMLNTTIFENMPISEFISAERTIAVYPGTFKNNVDYRWIIQDTTSPLAGFIVKLTFLDKMGKEITIVPTNGVFNNARLSETTSVKFSWTEEFSVKDASIVSIRCIEGNSFVGRPYQKFGEKFETSLVHKNEIPDFENFVKNEDFGVHDVVTSTNLADSASVEGLTTTEFVELNPTFSILEGSLKNGVNYRTRLYKSDGGNIGDGTLSLSFKDSDGQTVAYLGIGSDINLTEGAEKIASVKFNWTPAFLEIADKIVGFSLFPYFLGSGVYPEYDRYTTKKVSSLAEKEVVDNLDKRVSVLEEGEVLFREPIKQEIKRVNEILTEVSSGFRFVFATDIHLTSSEKLYKMAILGEMAKNVDAVILNGDILDGSKTDTKENQIRLLNNAVNKVKNNDSKKVFSVFGNHDNNFYWWNQNRTTENLISGKNFTNATLKGLEIYEDYNHQNQVYYYKDFERYRTRIIVLNFHQSFDDNGNNIFDNPAGNFTINNDQVLWLYHSALNFSDKKDKNEWKVLVFSHVPVVVSEAVEYMNLYNVNIIDNILKACKTGGTFANYDYVNTGYDEADSVFDFTAQGAVKVLANFSGHYHHDCADTNTSGIWSINTGCMLTSEVGMDGVIQTPETPVNVPSYPKRNTDDATSELFDIVTIDDLSNKIVCTRFGAGNSREFII